MSNEEKTGAPSGKSSSKPASAESVHVALRVRPLLGHENLQRCKSIVQYPVPNQVLIGDDRRFTYDNVFSESSTQDSVFEKCVSDLLSNFHGGYNATILAYGQTGSGKTFTMGTSSSDGVAVEKLGILPRFVHELFSLIDNNKETHSYQVRVSFIEIHNEDIHDLLNSDKNASAPQIREIDGQIVVQGTNQEEVKSSQEMLGCLERGSLCRTTGSTLMNATSSRSHAIFSVFLDQVKNTDIGNGEVNEEQLSSKFNFVDLAGSERLKRTGAVGQRMKEGISINSGLLALGNVISALGDPARKSGHIPYRDSKITRLLQDSLGGNSKTLMIACVSPADVNFEETLNTLKYANRAKNIQNKAVINRDPNAAKIEQMATRIRELEAALAAGGVAVETYAEVFAPSDEEYTYLKEQNKLMETEVKRLTSQLKDSRVDTTTLSETLMEVEKQRDVFRMQLLKISEMYPEVKVELSQRELDLIASNIEQITNMKFQILNLKRDNTLANNEITALKKQISSGLRGVGPALGGGDSKTTNDMFMKHTKKRSPSAIDDLDFSIVVQKVEADKKREKMDTTISGVGEVFSAMAMNDTQASNPDTDRDDDDEDETDVDDDVKSIYNVAAVKERQHNYNMKRMSDQHADLSTDIAQNENLLHQLMKTKETAMEMRKRYEEKLHTMEEELSRVTSQHKTEVGAMSDKDAKKAKIQYEKKMSALKKQIAELKVKLEENRRLHAIKEQDEKRIKSLQSKIDTQKAEKVKLSHKMKEEADKHRQWIKQKDKRVKTLEKESRKSKNEMSKLKRMMEKQEAVIRRKNEEKSALEKRLQSQKDVVASANLMRQAKSKMSTKASKKKGSAGGRGGKVYGDDVDELKDGFDDEIDRAVEYLDLMAEHEKLVQQRNEATESKKQADAMIENPDPNLSHEVIEYWADRSENLKSQINYLNRQVVSLRVSSAKCAESARDIRRNIFNRHRVRRMEHGRALILHLMDQLVAMKHEKRARDELIDDLQITLESQKQDLKAVTRQSLLLQKTPSAKKLLAEMDEMEAMMDRMKEERQGAQSDSYVVNVNAPNGQDDGAAEGEDDGDAAVDNSMMFHRLYPGPSPARQKSGPMTAWDELSAGSVSPSMSASASPRSPKSGDGGYASDYEKEYSRRRTRDRRSSNANGDEDDVEDEEEEEKQKGNKSVFDRLTNSKNFTGMHKNIHKDKPRVKKSASTRSFREKPIKEGKEPTTVSTPTNATSTSTENDRPGTRPASRSTSRRSRPQGNVFSRLTDESSFTGMHKHRAVDGKKTRSANNSSGGAAGGGKNKPLRSMSEMEKQFAELNADWTKDNVGKAKSQPKHRRNRSSVDATDLPTKVDKQTAQSAVKKLDSLFSKAKQRRSTSQLNLSAEAEADGDESDDGPSPSGREVLEAIETVIEN